MIAHFTMEIYRKPKEQDSTYNEDFEADDEKNKKYRD